MITALPARKKNLEVRDRFVRRTKFWQAVRDFMNSHGFLEINIPVLEHTTGGADANPFVTHMDALDQDFYLRISHELPLKRLLGAGYEKVYDFCCDSISYVCKPRLVRHC